MKIELPKHLKLTKVEQKIVDGIEELSRSFFNGLFFFITTPIYIYKKIKNKFTCKKIKPKEYYKGRVLEKIELPKRKLTKEECDLIYNKGKPLTYS